MKPASISHRMAAFRPDVSQSAGIPSEGRRAIKRVAGAAVVAALTLLAVRLDAQAPAPPSPPAPPVPEAPPAASPAPPAVTEPAAAPRFRAGQYVGPASCATANCHGSSGPRRGRVLHDEYTTWIHKDRHNRAHEALFSESAWLIYRNAKLAREPYAEPACLACHALAVPESAHARPIELEDGVSCESCHGPAGGWIDRHTEEGWTHEDSVAAGMTDLADLEVRAGVCLGCHLGSAERRVDHELIASGHPELVFELDNFGEAMPAHWRPHSERAAEGLPASGPARTWAVGQATAFRAGLLQLARRAQPDAWPEFAEMSCGACHHSLSEQRWRQLRGFKYRPGLPPWSPARWSVLRHLVARWAPAELAALEGEVEQVSSTVSSLCAPGRIRAAAERAAAALGRAIPAIAGAEWSDAQVRELIAAIAADREFLLRADRQSAEQAALAIQSLYSYLAGGDPSIAEGKMAATVNRLFDELDDPYVFHPERFLAALGDLERQIR